MLMQGHRLRRISIRLSLAILACGISLIVCGSAQATSRSAAQLRRTFAQTFLALRVTGNPTAACSSTTSEGQIALIQILHSEGQYLYNPSQYIPSMTCAETFAEAFAKRAQAKRAQAEPEYRGGICIPTLSALEMRVAIRKAVVHVRGNRGTVRLVDDSICLNEGISGDATGSVAVANDPLGTSHWIRKRGRWLFDDQPTGTYSPAGRGAVTMLRAALSGSTIREPGNLAPNIAAFCANGSTNFTFFGNPVGNVGPWYVNGGYPYTASGQLGPPFDAQGNPQGVVFVFNQVWGIKLVGGALVALPIASSTPIVTPGAAGC
jgi:hypothetical protein